MGAAIIKSGRVLSASPNGTQTGRHAEIRAIAKVDCIGATMFIARHGGEGSSRPCRACFMLLRSVGIKKIVFKEGGKVITKVVSEETPDNYRNYFL
jgi:deoxycytidylate deaminase